MLSSTNKDADLDASFTAGPITITAAIPKEGPGLTIFFGKRNIVIL
jgi:hypothetical protein